MNRLKFYNDEKTLYYQDDNLTETLFFKEDEEDFLQTCGPTAIVNLIAAAGRLKTNCYSRGRYIPKPETVIMEYFNNSENYEKFNKILPKVNFEKKFPNRYLELYPLMLKEIFDIKSKVEWKKFDDLDAWLDMNIGLFILLKEPSHFISIVGYNKIKDLIYYRDPWKDNPYNKKFEGINRVIKRKNLISNIHNARVLVGV